MDSFASKFDLASQWEQLLVVLVGTSQLWSAPAGTAPTGTHHLAQDDDIDLAGFLPVKSGLHRLFGNRVLLQAASPRSRQADSYHLIQQALAVPRSCVHLLGT